MDILLLLLVSALAGFVGSMAGMGGGVILIPFLTLEGVDIKVAIAASMVSVIATSSGAASAYVKDRISNVRIGMFLEMFTAAGAILGAAITVASGARLLFILFGIVLFSSWLVLFMRQNDGVPTVQNQDRLSAFLKLQGTYHDQASDSDIDYRATRAYLGGPLIFGAGLIAGMLGIGAGALKVLIHDIVMGLPPKVSTATSNFIIGVTALAGSSVYLASGLIDPALAGPVALGVLAGSFAGTRVFMKMRNRTVRYFFMGVLLLLGGQMILRGLGVL
jgi:uncharacterized membrane protein YfcA